MSWKIARCKHCDAGIIWAKNEKQKWDPVDAEPTEDGTHVLMGWDDPPSCVEAGAGELAFADLPRHTRHFRTCTQFNTRRRADGRKEWRT